MFGGSSFPRRSVQVAPKKSVVGRQIVIKQEVHAFGCFFLDSNVEREFQKYYRIEKQAGLPIYMVSMIIISIVWPIASAMERLTTASVAFAATVLPTTLGRLPSERITWITTADATVVIIVFSVLAVGCAIFLARRRDDLFWFEVRLDPMQLVLLFFYQLVIIPVVLAAAACIHLELTYITDFATAAQSEINQTVLTLLGISCLDMLYFYLLLATSMASCLLRMQFTYFVVIAIEFAVVVSAISSAFYPNVPERWALFVVFVSMLVLVARGVWDGELSCRREFLSQSNLLNENRRLSNQNIEMKEELSGKLNYQLHYEMGDILRILCQIKIKMSPHEKKDIDKIITALVTNEDLFGVSLDPSMAEHEDEVQGWLQMMAFKEAPPALVRGSARLISERLAAKKPTMQSQVSRITQSRKMSRNIQTEEKAAELINKFFIKEIAEERDELSRWLFDTIRDKFFLDMFYVEQHCSAPMQAVLITCVELNDFVARLSLDMKKLSAFAGAVENHYFKRNPYHNCLHAGAVIADLHFYLRRLKLNVDDITFFVGLIAAAAHDISHPGVSNGFLIATRSKLAITYSDDSVLERMHIAELYRILSHDKFDIFSHMDTPVRAEIRKLLIQMILATDLSRHFQHVSKLKSRKFAVADEGRGLEVPLIMETLLMLADLGHTAKPFAYHQLWANRIAEEFFRQGAAEERQNMPISPLCDRAQSNLPRSQITFLTLLATPLFETAGEAFAIEEYDTVMTDLQANIKMWQSMITRSESIDGVMASRAAAKSLKDKASTSDDVRSAASVAALPNHPSHASSVAQHNSSSSERRRRGER